MFGRLGLIVVVLLVALSADAQWPSWGGGGGGGSGGSATWDGGNFANRANGPSSGIAYSFQGATSYGMGLDTCTTPHLSGTCLRLVYNAAGSIGTEVIGHLSVSGELRAEDVAYIYAANGDLMNFYNESDVKVGQVDTEGELAIGGGTASFLGLQWWADYDGVNGTGWYRSAADTWMFRHNGFDGWKLTLDWQPQQDITSSIGDSTHRLLQVATRTLRAENTTWYASNGTTTQAQVDSSGRAAFAAGNAAIPGIGFQDDNDGTGTGFYRSAANTVGFSSNGTAYFTMGGSITPVTDNNVGLGSISNRWTQLAAATLYSTNALYWSGDFDGTPTGITRPSANVIRFLINNATMADVTSAGIVPVTDNYSANGTDTLSWAFAWARYYGFEGSTADGNETTLNAVDPTADRTINLPNASGLVAVLENSTPSSYTSGTCTNETGTGSNGRGSITADCTAGQTAIVSFGITLPATPVCVCTPANANAAASAGGAAGLYCDASTTALTITAASAYGGTGGKVNFVCVQ